ncbi:MAG: UMP kinase [Parcubacteria group bacterium CG10_big_fil_rev_8_21_14_0_10_36_14]|nr:MAG: UMP kinase [Parcubacteria group bacterium CG10_big_fil_rev_8_21_14_0_10_36_14]
MKKTIVISLGGSLIVPKGGIDILFLKKFKKLIADFAKKDYKIILICGGGRTARDYQKSAKAITKLTRDDLDWIGIHATRLNGHLVRTIFRDIVHPTIIKNPNQKVIFKEKVLIGVGWRPGCSTDYDAVLLAKTYGAKKVINLTNIDYLYDKNPTIYKNAKKIKEIDWQGFRKIVGNKWDPGANTPFDPIASREAQKLGLELILANGKKLDNLKKIIRGDKNFIGSIVYNH